MWLSFFAETLSSGCPLSVVAPLGHHVSLGGLRLPPNFFVGRGWGRCDRTSVCRCVLTGNVSNSPDSRADVNVHCNLLHVLNVDVGKLT